MAVVSEVLLVLCEEASGVCCCEFTASLRALSAVATEGFAFTSAALGVAPPHLQQDSLHPKNGCDPVEMLGNLRYATADLPF